MNTQKQGETLAEIEHWFDDDLILDQGSVAMRLPCGKMTNGVYLKVGLPEPILLSYEELKVALEYLEKDRWVYGKKEDPDAATPFFPGLEQKEGA